MAMSPALMLNILVGMAYMAIDGLVGTFLLVRAKKAKLPNLTYLGLFFVINAVAVLFQTSGLMITIQAIGFTMLVPFTYTTFYKGREGPYKPLVLLAVALAAATILVKGVRVVSGLEAELYYVNTAFINTLVLVGATWLSLSALVAYRDVKDKSIEPWIQKRYLLVGWSTIFLAWTGIAPFFMSYGAGFSETSQAILIVSMTVVSLVHAVTSYLCWVMPAWFKRLLNGGAVDAPLAVEEMTEDEVLAMLEAAEHEDAGTEHEVVAA